MLRSYILKNKEHHFVEDTIDNPNENIFTIIVGKNGTGKSRLLNRIVSEFLDFNNIRRFYSNREQSENVKLVGKVHFSYSPDKIIAVSTSPFDRFPIERLPYRRNENPKNYSYLGLRDLMSRNFGLAYLSKIIGSLIEAAFNNPTQMKEISNVLDYLGYSDTITIAFRSRAISRYIKI